MRKALAVFGGVLLLILAMVLSASADNGPHGGYSAMTDKCSACHRAHTALGEKLLINTNSATDKSNFCYSCHTGGMGAYTDVKNGLFVANATVPTEYENTELDDGFGYVYPTGPLPGGGFEQAVMNTNLNSTGGVTRTVTSNHMVNGGTNTVWGYGALGSGNVGTTGVALTCTNCHNPHGGAGEGNQPTFRILKGKSGANSPLFGSINSNVDVLPENGQAVYVLMAYDVSFTHPIPPDTYMGVHSGGGISSTMPYASLTAWCSQCHQRYAATWTGLPGQTPSADAIYKYRHPTNDSTSSTCISCHKNGFGNMSDLGYVPGCISCHVAHGTTAQTNGAYADNLPWPDGTTTPNGNSRSALLRLDGRGVCWKCHNNNGVIDKEVKTPYNNY